MQVTVRPPAPALHPASLFESRTKSIRNHSTSPTNLKLKFSFGPNSPSDHTPSESHMDIEVSPPPKLNLEVLLKKSLRRQMEEGGYWFSPKNRESGDLEMNVDCSDGTEHSQQLQSTHSWICSPVRNDSGPTDTPILSENKEYSKVKDKNSIDTTTSSPASSSSEWTLADDEGSEVSPFACVSRAQEVKQRASIILPIPDIEQPEINHTIPDEKSRSTTSASNSTQPSSDVKSRDDCSGSFSSQSGTFGQSILQDFFILYIESTEKKLESLPSSKNLLSTEKSWFFSSIRPSISMREYLHHFLMRIEIPSSALVIALVYLDRILSKRIVPLSLLSIHRLVLTSVLVASKFLDDHHYLNAAFAHHGLVDLFELNGAESEFLFLIKFELNVKPSLFQKYQNGLMRFGNSRTAANVPRKSTRRTSVDFFDIC